MPKFLFGVFSFAALESSFALAFATASSAFLSFSRSFSAFLIALSGLSSSLRFLFLVSLSFCGYLGFLSAWASSLVRLFSSSSFCFCAMRCFVGNRFLRSSIQAAISSGVFNVEDFPLYSN